MTAKTKKLLFIFGFLSLFTLGLGFQNCSKIAVKEIPEQVSASSTGQTGTSTATGTTAVAKTGSYLVAASHPNPPLDLFFIVDNSGSMLEHQINLGNAFKNIFTNNANNLANFDVNIYVYSTSSTINAANLSWLPTVASVNSLPAVTDAKGSDFAATPGAVFSTWDNMNTSSGGVMTQEFMPAPVLVSNGGSVTPFLHIAAQGATSAQDYATNINNLTALFQNQLAYLNPTHIQAYEPFTDISSGLCTMSRILKHSNDMNLIKAGDSAAFVIVSDDDDRINVRNPAGNECIESIVTGANVISGNCGNYSTTFSQNTTVPQASISSYTIPATPNNTDTFSFKLPMMKMTPSYPVESCTAQWTTTSTSYSDAITYTSTTTAYSVSYIACNMYDGICDYSGAATSTTVSRPGQPVSETNCPSDVATSLPSQAKVISCSGKTTVSSVQKTAIDTQGSGTCSSSVLNSNVPSDGSATQVSCVNTTSNTTNISTKALSNVAVGTCNDYCSQNPTLSNCSLKTAVTQSTANGSTFNMPNNSSCSSSCSDSGGYCTGTGTVLATVQSKYGTSATCAVAATTVAASIAVNSAAATCSTPLTGLTITKTSGIPKMTSACTSNSSSTIAQCLTSLDPSISCSAPAASGGVAASTHTPVYQAVCSDLCTSVSTGCKAPTSGATPTIAQYYNQTYGSSCTDGTKTVAGAAVSMNFAQNNESCSSLCSDALPAGAGCDGKGWGVSNNNTVSDYVTYLGGSACAVASVKNNLLATATTIPAAGFGGAAQSLAICSTANAADPIFFPSGSAQRGPASDQYVLGKQTNSPADFISYISSQANSIFGANNMPAVAAITNLGSSLDQQELDGTVKAAAYLNLVQVMGNSQPYDVADSDYSSALSGISDFIVKSTQNSYPLSIPANVTMTSVSVMHDGVTTVLTGSQWTWSGQTLSISSAANLQVGDELSYNYLDPN